ncbi:MAG: VWA domain-containing protein [Bryobacteraceae bacterium]|nr:VWA domain-containing protein [Bryobacteraceae bacterium]
MYFVASKLPMPALIATAWLCLATAAAQSSQPPATPAANAPAQASDSQPKPAAAKPAAATDPKTLQSFRTGVSEVVVPVTVTDPKGKFVTNLDERDFELYDNGRQQKIAFFSRERNQPVVIGYLIDLSNTNRLQWDKLREAIQDLILATLSPDGKIDPRFSGYLIGYSTEAELMVNTTTDPEKLLDRVRKLKPGGGSAMYDAIYQACTSRTLVKGEPIEPRRVIVIVGDGHDTASKKTLDEVLEIAQKNMVTIYGVSTTSFGFFSEGDERLKRLANATGGRVVYPLENVYKDVDGYLSKPQDAGNFALTVGTGGYASAIMNGMVDAIGATAGEIQLQYILRYVPDEADVAKKFRKIEVRVNLPFVTVRAREGYFPLSQ